MILSKEHELMRKNFRNFAETEFTTEIQEQLDREGGFNWEIWEKMAKYGFAGVKIPVEYGGQGGDALAYALMNEEFCRVCPVLGIYANTPNSLGGGPLLACGNEEQLQKYLAPAARGEKHIVFAPVQAFLLADAAEHRIGIHDSRKSVFHKADKSFIQNSVFRFLAHTDHPKSV